MRYQDLIDKYANPNYTLSGSTSPSFQTYNRLDVTSKTQYTSQAQLSSKYRSKSRKRLDYTGDGINTAKLLSPSRYIDNKLVDSSTDAIYKQSVTQSDLLSPLNRATSPRSSQRRNNLRETIASEITYRDNTTRQLGAFTSSTSNLLTPTFDSKPSFNTFKDISPRKATGFDVDKYLTATDYPRQNHFLSPAGPTLGLSKQNNPPEQTSYLHLTQSSHTRNNGSSQNKLHASNDHLFASSAGMTALAGKTTRPAENETNRQNRVNSTRSNKDLDMDKPKPASKFQQEKKAEKIEEKMNGEFGPNGFTNLTKSDFQIGKCKGEGKFGKIYPVKHLKTGSLYALKQIPKKIIKQNMMQDQLVRQIKLQYFFNHSNLVKLYGFFSDETNIYLLMEYMQQGELYSLLKKQKKFTQAFTACRVHEVCEALHYLHDMDVVHRDIKLENVVLSNGVAKLCDFGWAAPIDGRRTTYCGTFDYASPEIIQGKEYDQNVDLWSLGVMTFEMMTGQLPFYSISRSQTIKNILNVEQKKINFPADMSAKAQNFIERLLRKNPEERVNIAMLLKHPFLQDSCKTHKKF